MAMMMNINPSLFPFFASLTNMLAAADDDDAEGGKGRFTREA